MEQRLDNQDKYELKNLISTTDDPNAIKAFIDTKVQENSNLTEGDNINPYNTIKLSENQKKLCWDKMEMQVLISDAPEEFLIDNKRGITFDNFKFKDNIWYLEKTYDEDYPWTLIIDDVGIWDELTEEDYEFISGARWYFTLHGVQPGSIPRGAHVLKIQDGQNEKGTWGTYVMLDRVLSTRELNYYDIKEAVPPATEYQYGDHHYADGKEV